MDEKVIVPLVSALLGTLIGSMSSIVIIWLQLKAQSKRERARLASEMAREDHKFTYELALKHGRSGKLQPVTSFQHFHYEVLVALENGTLTEKEIVKIKDKNRKLMNAIEKINDNA